MIPSLLRLAAFLVAIAGGWALCALPPYEDIPLLLLVAAEHFGLIEWARRLVSPWDEFDGIEGDD